LMKLYGRKLVLCISKNYLFFILFTIPRTKKTKPTSNKK
jgi:hypothetical protein